MSAMGRNRSLAKRPSGVVPGGEFEVETSKLSDRRPPKILPTAKLGRGGVIGRFQSFLVLWNALVEA